MKRSLAVPLLLLFLMAIAGGCGGPFDKNVDHSQTSGDKIGISLSESKNDNEGAKKQEKKIKPAQADKKAGTQEKASGKGKTALTGQDKTDNKSLPANQAASRETANSVRLLVTSDFGRKQIFNKQVPLPKDARVIDVLKDNVDVATCYGGGFVSAINGIKSGASQGKRQDWFYYLNGICCATGSGNMKPHEGDTIWWDYHQWAAGPANSALIGLYPEPFIHGYQGQVKTAYILYADGEEATASKLKDALTAKGCSQIKVLPAEENLLASRNGPTIIVGEWNRLQSIAYLDNLNKAYKKSGMSIHFNGGELELLSIAGQVIQKLSGNVGVIVAAGSGLGDTCPLWIVSGTSSGGVNQAVNILVNEPQRIAGMYSAAITSGQVIRLPLN